MTNPLSLNLYAYGYSNPIRYIDPSGNIVTDWDKSHLTKAEQGQVEQLTKDWWAADTAEARAAIHTKAEGIRDQYRSDNETGRDDGYTVDKSTGNILGAGSNIGGVAVLSTAVANLSKTNPYITAGLIMTSIAALAVDAADSAKRNSEEREVFIHYTSSFSNARSIYKTGLRPDETGVAYATKDLYVLRSSATNELATYSGTRKWGVVFSVPKNGLNRAEYVGGVSDWGKPGEPGYLGGGGQEWVFRGVSHRRRDSVD